MKKLLFTTFAIALFFTACGGGGGGTTTTTTTTTTTPASTTAVQSSSAGTGAVSASTGTTTTFQNISKISVAGGQAPKFKAISVPGGNAGLDKAALLTGGMGDSPMMKAAVEKAHMAAQAGPKATTSTACTDGGSYTGGVASSTNYTVTFTNCKEGGNMYDGKVTMALGAATGSSVPITMTFAGKTTTTKFTITSFSGTYDVAVLKMEMNLKIVNTYTPGATSTAYTYAMVADGTMNLTDYSTTNTYAFTFTSFGNTVVVSSGTAFSTTISGKFAESWTDAGVSSSVTMTYTSFKVDMTDDLTNTTLSPSGTVSIVYTPSTKCSVTSVTVATVTPIKYVNATGKTIAGKITLNSTTSVTFNADGTVTVSDGTNSTSYASSYDMGKECPFAVPNADTAAPPAATSTTTTGVTATSMTVTSVSKAATGGSLACYTDLHVNYYNVVAPTATTAGTWYVDWHSGLGCTNPTTFTFEEAKDIDSDGTCDVGLDINGAAMDDTSGGLEHFTALKLPAGYYVISMNNYSCATGTTNDVTIQLGSNVYGPYAASYTASSADGTTLGAWARVRDVRVNASGTVDVLSPDTNLSPWHSGTFGFAPQYAGKR